MTEEKEHSFNGVLMGIVVCSHGEPHIGISIGNDKIAMNIDHAGMVFQQLGDLLETAGYFDDEELEETTCRMH